MDETMVRLPLVALSEIPDYEATAREITLLQRVEDGTPTTVIGVRLPAGLGKPAAGFAYTIDWGAPGVPALVVDWESSVTNTAHHPPVSGDSRYVAHEHMVWGDGWLAPGDPVPDYEPGRDYAALFAEGKIVHASPGVVAAIDAREARDGHR